MTNSILISVALVLIIEGIGPMLFANKWQRFLHHLSQQPVNQLRATGGVLVTIGIVSLLYLV
ncbi:DUF2065 domain-containing protein [Paraglaciecola aquimarina]|uniref:DUF2065 domain-containing protein n=1 Tax=Paraglaciecola algarum TaxID=3050085 RepID=A0ABS9DE52_9ALTE|nr:DUF2065 domain-containing protein [Paraglaciecola sp. G1-23]MCF2950317.1 DUF2065 domain-containing protein [Paraglaciecola sp. G1-23]